MKDERHFWRGRISCGQSFFGDCQKSTEYLQEVLLSAAEVFGFGGFAYISLIPLLFDCLKTYYHASFGNFTEVRARYLFDCAKASFEIDCCRCKLRLLIYS